MTTDKVMENTGLKASSGGARPMKVFTDANGYWWLCDANVDPRESFEAQQCWRYDLMAFDRND